ncbi:hypothetical protein L345_15416, partial [Ophiophagus hannah]
MPAPASAQLLPHPPAWPATPPCFRAESPDKLAFYLNWVCGDNYTNDQEIITTITKNLEGEAAEWLGNINEFLQQLRKRFKDMAQGQEAEEEIEAIKQRADRRVCQRVLELTGKLRYWLECLIVHFLKKAWTGLNRKLHNTCICCRIPDCIHN